MTSKDKEIEKDILQHKYDSTLLKISHYRRESKRMLKKEAKKLL